ncbi:MAG: hypothetical protein DRH76_09790 [Deltaproteobacteria bacterium]|nr:MAG: hypothetical protein DRH76_09790 [Deltaproteobacteria bacterium]
MEEPMDNGTGPDPQDFKRFAIKRIVVVVLLGLAILWVVATVAGFFSADPELAGGPTHSTTDTLPGASGAETAVHGASSAGGASAQHGSATEHGVSAAQPEESLHGGVTPHDTAADQAGQGAHGGSGAAVAPDFHAPVAKVPAGSRSHGTSSTVASGHAAPGGHTPQADHGTPSSHAAPSGHDAYASAGHGAAPSAPQVPGVAFVDAVIKPMAHELHDRFWGWRPNDILNFTDNVNNFQLGVLEVTRRTAVILAERVSRAGSTEAFDKNLENAMNWFMVSADKYWFPSPEGKYKEGLKELAAYRDRLERGGARFWTRTDSLIPLLAAYEDLLGSCDENLVKAKEADGSEVSFFAADDYFFYAKGVASALYEILHAVEKDFYVTLEARRGLGVLHHAIESCHHAIEIDPIVVTNASLSGILANHRANMAAPISHARFYLGVLIETLST